MSNVTYNSTNLSAEQMSPNLQHQVNLPQSISTIVCCYLEHVTAIKTAMIQNPQMFGYLLEVETEGKLNPLLPLDSNDLKTIIKDVKEGFGSVSDDS